ncbi:hypothetical protein NCCP2222_25210 [Sporosarcina sp. NCCP-2222]|uniref:hypothetical protein n=1 Tax=Sporosarcina sp. NCCP-2222 TaxID=2935073 RepID=UPI0020801D99|nr:hypothetical protein [Sporosarcina sp. NCCP-2222]GKV56574.1 hypothetical protein NCCP2222_25210 [Sporosarcina sp. NCCP-2222]
MDKNAKDLKKEIDDVISPTAYFTELDKQRIRAGIRRIENGTTRIRLRPWPLLLTGAAVCAFVIILGGLVGKELGFFTNAEPTQKAPPQSDAPSVPDPTSPKGDIPILGDIETDMLNILFQDIHGDTAIWSGNNETTESDSGGLELYVYSLHDKKIVDSISPKSGFQVYGGQINAEWLTWVEAGKKNGRKEWRIYGMNRKTHKKIVIRDSSDVPLTAISNGEKPWITMSTGANQLAWAEPAKGTEEMLIQLYDLETGKLETAGKSEISQPMPKLSDQYLAWSNTSKEFIVYSIEEKKTKSTFVNKVETLSAKLNDKYVVWMEHVGNNDFRLLMGAIAGSRETELFRGEINTYEIGEDYVIWESGGWIYSYSWAYRQTIEQVGLAESPAIRGNTIIWRQTKEVENKPILTFQQLEKPEFMEYQDKIFKTSELGERNQELEKNVDAWLADNNIFGSDLKNGLYGIYLDKTGTVVVDFVPFGNLIGVPAWEERRVLIDTLNEILFSTPQVKEIYYTFNLNFTAFGDWTERGEHVYKRDNKE